MEEEKITDVSEICKGLLAALEEDTGMRFAFDSQDLATLSEGVEEMIEEGAVFTREEIQDLAYGDQDEPSFFRNLKGYRKIDYVLNIPFNGR